MRRFASALTTDLPDHVLTADRPFLINLVLCQKSGSHLSLAHEAHHKTSVPQCCDQIFRIDFLLNHRTKFPFKIEHDSIVPMRSLQTCLAIFVTLVIVSVISVAAVDEKDVKSKEGDETEADADADASESRAVKKDKRFHKKPPTITIPIRNAVVQALAPIERHAAEAASYKPSRDSYDDPGGVVGDIVYEDEFPGDLEGWIPPPPPPPETLFRRPSYHSPHHHITSPTLTRLASIRPHLTSARLFGDDFALFLVILTIAGFFGLLLAMFMPFTFLMNQQPVGVGIAPYPPYGQVTATPSSVYGYPYGRRKRSVSHHHSQADDGFGSVDYFVRLLLQAMDKYDGNTSSNNRNKISLKTGSSAAVLKPMTWELATASSSSFMSSRLSSSAAQPLPITRQT
jgi:hypothetical protein